MNEIDFYKIKETLNNKYYQIPQELFVNRLYKEKLNSDSKILYAFLLDRLSLSQKNHWFDKEGRVYLIFTSEEVQNKLCLSEKTVTKAFKQLTDVNLIAEKRQGLGKPNLIYVGKIQHENINNFVDTENLPTINPNNIKTNIINIDYINPQNNERYISLDEVKEKCKLDEFKKRRKVNIRRCYR